MRDQDKTKQQLITENEELRRRVAAMESVEAQRKQSEEELRRSAAKWHSVAENAPLFVAVVDQSGKMQFLNRYRPGFVPETVVGRPIYDFLQPQYHAVAQKCLEDVFQTGERASYECVGAGPDGSVSDYATDVGPVVVDGEIIAATLISRDITARTRAEVELREERNRAQQYLDVAGVVMVALDNSGKIHLLNRKGHELLGYDDGELLGKDWFHACVPQRIRDETKSAFKELIAGRSASAEYHENPVLTKCGEERIIAWHNAVLTDELGNIVGTLSSGSDITEKRQAEEALRASEAKYRRLHDSMRDAFVSVDMDGRIKEYNETHRQMLGYEPEELLTLRYTDITPEAWHSFEAEIVERQVLQRGYSDVYEKEYRRKDGTVFPVEMRTFLIKDDEGSPSAMWAIVRDITERKQTEQEVAKSRATLQAMMECLPFDFFAIGPDGRYVLENAVCRAHWGRLVGKTPAEMAPTEDVRASWLENNRRAFAGERVEDEATVTIQGEERFVYNILTPIHDARDFYGILGVNVDITERRRAEAALQKAHDELERRVEERTAELLRTNEQLKREIEDRRHIEEALRQSEERYRTVVEDQTEVICRFDADGEFIFVNDVYCRFFGKRSEDLLGKKWHPVVLPEDLPMIKEELRGMSPSNPIVTIENRVYSGLGEVHWMQFVNRGFFDQTGRLTEVQAVGRDITARKRAEEALHRERRTLEYMLRASDHERQLIAYDIHDGLAQELAGAIMQFQVYDHLKDTKPEDAAEAYQAGTTLLKHGHFEARRLISGVRPPILDEAGVMEAIAHLAHEQNQTTTAKIEVHSKVKFARLPPVLENTIYRIVQEALTNACKHSKSERIRVALLQRDTQLRIEIRDWGIGFNSNGVPEHRFGLVGIRERARLLGGKSRIRSEPGEGTRISVELPLLSRRSDG